MAIKRTEDLLPDMKVKVHVVSRAEQRGKIKSFVTHFGGTIESVDHEKQEFTILRGAGKHTETLTFQQVGLVPREDGEYEEKGFVEVCGKAPFGD